MTARWARRLSAVSAMLSSTGRGRHRDALHSEAAQEMVRASWGPATAAVTKLVGACVAEGTIAPGQDPADIIMLMSFLWRVPNNDAGVAQGRRLIAAVFSGLENAPKPL